MPVRILQLSDLHLSADPTARLKGVPTRETLREVLDHATDHAGDIDHVILTGDLAHDGQPDSYRALREILGERYQPSHIIPGNHDDRAAIRSIFGEVVPEGTGPLTFSRAVGGWRLIGLDSLEDGEVTGRIEAEQLDWLRGQLIADPASPTLLFIHHPPVSVDCAWLDAIGLQEANELIKLIAVSRQVRAICAGHVHHASQHRLSHAVVLTSPSTGVQFDPAHEGELAFHHVPPGYRILELEGETWQSEVVRLPGLNYPPVSGD